MLLMQCTHTHTHTHMQTHTHTHTCKHTHTHKRTHTHTHTERVNGCKVNPTRKPMKEIPPIYPAASHAYRCTGPLVAKELHTDECVGFLPTESTRSQVGVLLWVGFSCFQTPAWQGQVLPLGSLTDWLDLQVCERTDS